MNIYNQLVNNLKQCLHEQNLNHNDFIYRISMIQDLERVKKFGSSRVGLSNKKWDKLSMFNPDELPFFPILHEDVIIGSYFDDIEKDSQLLNGTLAHKLCIYEQPFFTLYNKIMLQEIAQEKPEDNNNQGRHFIFLNSKILALHSLWQIHNDNNNLYVKEILWKKN